MDNKKKMGRPLTSDGVRDIKFIVRLDRTEREELDKKAKKNNMTSAEYIRYLIKKDK